mmetsp:Transcript_26372/g.25245  ORF Transcript_26372/g.25245 Transcript_26372/m.25245 type:complete len:152 (-) Transcript_26372:438-893(-)
MKIESIPFRKIAIKAPNLLYLKVLGDSGVIKAEADVIDEQEIFTIHPCNESSQFALQSYFGGFLCAENGKKEAEKFRFSFIEKCEGHSSIWRGNFLTSSDSYLTISHEHSHFTANTRDRNEAAIFEIICMDSTDINSKDNGFPTAVVLGGY